MTCTTCGRDNPAHLRSFMYAYAVHYPGLMSLPGDRPRGWGSLESAFEPPRDPARQNRHQRARRDEAEAVALRRHEKMPARHRKHELRILRCAQYAGVAAGAGGLAVGVHTTQFAIREHGLYETVLRSAMEDRLAWSDRPMAMVAGLCGKTEQAKNEARIAVSLGYHAGLLSLAALYAAWRVARAALDAVRRLPRSNDDLVFF